MLTSSEFLLELVKQIFAKVFHLGFQKALCTFSKMLQNWWISETLRHFLFLYSWMNESNLLCFLWHGKMYVFTEWYASVDHNILTDISGVLRGGPSWNNIWERLAQGDRGRKVFTLFGEPGNLAPEWKVGVTEGEMEEIGGLKEVGEGRTERAELQKGAGCPFSSYL